MIDIVKRLRLVAEERPTKMDRASCYETEAADVIESLRSQLQSALAELRQCYKDDGCTEQEIEDQLAAATVVENSAPLACDSPLYCLKCGSYLIDEKTHE